MTSVAREEIKEGWEMNRRNACKPLEGGRRVRKYGPKVDLTSWRKESKYADFFHEGRVLTLSNFLKEKGFDPRRIGNQEQQRAFIEKAIGRKRR